MKETLPLDSILVEQLARIKNVKTYRLVLKILQLIHVDSAELSHLVSMKINDIDNRLGELQYLQLIDKYKNQNDGAITYCIHKALANGSIKCDNCRFKNTKSYKKVKYFKCRLTDVDCLHEHWRKAYAFHKLLPYAGFVKTNFAEKLNGEDRSNEAREVNADLVDDWQHKDFVDFLHQMYQDYDHVVKINKSVITKHITRLKQAFIVEFGDDWKFCLKMYIKYIFIKADEKKYIPSMKIMAEKNNIQDFVDNSNIKVSICSINGIRCPYWKEKCTVDDCTTNVIKRVVKGYN